MFLFGHSLISSIYMLVAIVVEKECFLSHICNARLGVALNLQNNTIEFLVSRCVSTLFFVYAAQFLEALSSETGPLSSLKPDGTSFNIQNPIPYKSQKAGFFPETIRANKCQRGRGGRAERAKEVDKVPAEGIDTHLGA